MSQWERQWTQGNQVGRWTVYTLPGTGLIALKGTIDDDPAVAVIGTSMGADIPMLAILSAREQLMDPNADVVIRVREADYNSRHVTMTEIHDPKGM